MLIDILTPRQVEIAKRVADGWTNKAIADEMTVEPRTVQNQLTRIYSMLTLSNEEMPRMALARMVLEDAGLLINQRCPGHRLCGGLVIHCQTGTG